MFGSGAFTAFELEAERRREVLHESTRSRAVTVSPEMTNQRSQTGETAGPRQPLRTVARTALGRMVQHA